MKNSTRMRIIRFRLISIFLCGVIAFLAGCAAEEIGYSIENKSWDEIVDDARGSELRWSMWGGSDVINSFVYESIGDRLKELYDIDLYVELVVDIALVVSRIESEVDVAPDQPGQSDLLWINGENFKSLRESNLLFGPYLDILPNTQYLAEDSLDYQYDFGYPIDGYESPYGAAQFVFVYDSARMDEPPSTFESLLRWIRANPGRFTYPAPPDFVGSAFIRHVFYHALDGHQAMLIPFSDEAYEPIRDQGFRVLDIMKEYLWKKGEFYPTSMLQLDELFANGTVDISMSYQANEIVQKIEDGRFPDTARAFVLESGTIGNIHFVGIPINAKNIPAALVAANLILSPEVQLEKLKYWGDLSVLSFDQLPKQWVENFEAIPTHPASVSPDTLSRVRLPEVGADWVTALEKDWAHNYRQ